jgi:hypothetical protein
MSVILKGGASSDLANVDGNKNLNVVTPSTATNAGFIIAAGESSDGTAPLSGMTAVGRKNIAAEVNGDYQLRVGLENMLFYDIFNGVTFNTSVYSGVDTTMTKALSGGFLNLNSGNSVTAGQGTIVRTYRNFTVYGPSPIYIETFFQISQVPQTNNVCEWGCMYASGVTIPTDGVYFRINNVGTLECVVNTNGIEQQSVVTGAVIASNTTYHTIIAIDEDQAQFWFNDIYVSIPIPRGTAGAGITLGSSYPLMFREYNSNTVGTAQQFRVGRCRVSQGSIATNKPWNEAMAGAGLHSFTTPPGVVTATGTANYANSAAPAAGTLSNTAQAYSTLGGQWQAVMVAGAETDYALFGYQNPPGSATIPARNLYINNVRIGETFNTVAANAATPIILQWGFAGGSTSTSLAAADSATAGTRSPRRVTLGGQQFATGAVVGSVSPGFGFQFVPPVIVEPGTYAHVILKVVSGTATGNNIRGSVTISGNWE